MLLLAALEAGPLFKSFVEDGLVHFSGKVKLFFYFFLRCVEGEEFFKVGKLEVVDSLG